MRKEQITLITLIVIVILSITALGVLMWRVASKNTASTPLTTTEQTKTSNTSSTDKKTIAPSGATQEFSITARKWEYSPSTITVTAGEKVTLLITSTDVTHGFALPAFRVNERLEPYEEKRIEFVADKVGTYPFFSSVFAGEGTKNMRGSIIVRAQ